MGVGRVLSVAVIQLSVFFTIMILALTQQALKTLYFNWIKRMAQKVYMSGAVVESDWPAGQMDVGHFVRIESQYEKYP